MTHAAKVRTGTLDDIATDSHVFSIIAMDQRNTLRRMFTAAGLEPSDNDLRTAKADVARVLTPAATGLLSDPTYGVPAIARARALAPGCGLLIAAEPSERRSYQGEPRTHRDPALNARWLLDQGGDAYKFFVQLRADRPAPGRGEPDLVGETLAVCEEIIRDCRAVGVPVVIENLIYEIPGEDLSGQARENAIIEAARALNDLDIDLLKLEYPGSPGSSAGPGRCCRPACPSTSSPTSSGSRRRTGEPRASSPAAPYGARWSASPGTSARSSSPPSRCRGWRGSSRSPSARRGPGPRQAAPRRARPRSGNRERRAKSRARSVKDLDFSRTGAGYLAAVTAVIKGAATRPAETRTRSAEDGGWIASLSPRRT